MKLLSSGNLNTKQSFGILLLRLGAGLLMAFSHGYPKLVSYSDKADSFPDPLGVGSEFSLILAIFSEFVCAILLALGALTRLVLIPLIITMIVAVFIIHADDPFSKKEFGLLYLIPYLTILFTGAGKYSIDKIIGK